MPYSSKVANRHTRISSIDAKSYPTSAGYPHMIGRDSWTSRVLSDPGKLSRWNMGGRRPRGFIPYIGMAYNSSA
jgi:hypothetical protein